MDLAPDEFVALQRSYARDTEKIPDSIFEDADNYKIAYRTCCVLIAPDYASINEGKDYLITKIEDVFSPNAMIDYLKSAHPYFAYLFSDPKEDVYFKDLYKFIYSTWWEVE